MERWYMGIDPGVSGAYAFYKNPEEYFVHDYTEHSQSILDDILLIKPSYALLEKIVAMPSQSSKTTAVQFENYGIWKMALRTCKVPTVIETPVDWRKAANIHMPTYKPSSKLTPSQNKNKKKKLNKAHLLQVGRDRFPEADLKRVMDTDRAEALLMAFACSKIIED